MIIPGAGPGPGIEQRDAGSGVNYEVAVGLHDAKGPRIALRTRIPPHREVGQAINHQIAVALHNELVLSVSRLQELARRELLAGSQDVLPGGIGSSGSSNGRLGRYGLFLRAASQAQAQQSRQ